MNKSTKASSTRYDEFDNLAEVIAQKIADGKVIGWFQERMEFGPRALGNRSILADPRDLEMRERINRIIKNREDFRPLAPSVLNEYAAEWFEIGKPTLASDFMLLSYPVKPAVANKIPAVLHRDNTARLQTVKAEYAPRYASILRGFYARTQVPLLLNTSYNDQEPIVCTPDDAIQTFTKAQIDVLAIGSFLVEKASNAKYL